MATKHYYRIQCPTELGKQFRKFWHDCNKAEKAAEIFAKKVGAEAYYTSPTAFAGGVACVSFKNEEKVNRKLWRPLGKDADGAEQWEPDVKHRNGVLLLPRKDFRPSDTANRVYSKRNSRFGEVRMAHTTQEWAAMIGLRMTGDVQRDAAALEEAMSKELFCRYTEVYRDDAVATASMDRRYKLTWVARESIRIEVARMKLPVVSTERLLHLLEADLLDGMPDDGKPKFVRPVTPTFFEWADRYYIGVAYPCSHPDLEEITEGTYRLKMLALRQAEEARRMEES